MVIAIGGYGRDNVDRLLPCAGRGEGTRERGQSLFQWCVALETISQRQHAHVSYTHNTNGVKKWSAGSPDPSCAAGQGRSLGRPT